MKPITCKRSKFKLTKFLDALHRFSLQNLGNGDPLPVAVGDTVYNDPVDLTEALAADGDEEMEIHDTSLGRLEAGLALFAGVRRLQRLRWVRLRRRRANRSPRP